MKSKRHNPEQIIRKHRISWDPANEAEDLRKGTSKKSD
jgi:hypothetical protein